MGHNAELWAYFTSSIAPFKKILAVLSIILLANIILLGLIISQYNGTFTDTSNWVQHTLIVLDESGKISSNIQDLQSVGLPGSQSQVPTLGRLQLMP